ncbi:MAG: hypothetical protein Q8M09_19455 [Pseudomonadota bacterium]|nr:hypothetical protein [Pseudomonadota bacterium]MDP1906394.1 hypothetical protein [Pseudomonadota bacterium]MDP2351471.1 hypothetical protein [Pseudomonadota bacterium]
MNILPRSLLLLAVLPLSGCLQDTASYSFPEKEHAITLVRNQSFFWQDKLEVEVIVIRLPQCNGGLSIKDISLDTRFDFYQAPDEYPEPLYLLKSDKRVFAVSTQSCRVQEFQETPPDLGSKLGAFRVSGKVFQFIAADPSGKAEEE